MPSHSLDSSFARGAKQERFPVWFRSKPTTSHHITVFFSKLTSIHLLLFYIKECLSGGNTDSCLTK